MTQLEIARMGRRGEAVAEANGRPLYVPFALTGELVEAEIDCVLSKDEPSVVAEDGLNLGQAIGIRPIVADQANPAAAARLGSQGRTGAETQVWSRTKSADRPSQAGRSRLLARGPAARE